MKKPPRNRQMHLEGPRMVWPRIQDPLSRRRESCHLGHGDIDKFMASGLGHVYYIDIYT